MHIDALHSGEDLETTFTRALFERLNANLIQKTFDIVDSVLSDAKRRKDQVDDVLLVGGSSRIPYIREKLSQMFGKDKIRTDIEPDEAVAYGAGVYAAKVAGENAPDIRSLHLRDVIPLSLGIRVKGDVTSVIIERNTEIPTTRTKQFDTTQDNQTRVNIKVFEGERASTFDNHQLGEFVINKVPPMPAGKAKIDVKFSIDDNGILDVSAWETTTGTFGSIVISSDKRTASEAEIQRMIEEGDRWKKKDDEYRGRVLAQNNLEAKLLKFENSTNPTKLVEKCRQIREWLDRNKNAERQQFIAKLRELEAIAATCS